MTREQEGKVKPGLTGWVNNGIKIQEAQWVNSTSASFKHWQFQSWIGSLCQGSGQSSNCQSEAGDRVMSREAFQATWRLLWGQSRPFSQLESFRRNHDPLLSEEIVDDDDWSDCKEEMQVPTVTSLPDQRYGWAEHQQIVLPSLFQVAFLPTSLGEARWVEIELWVAQANNALKHLREAIGYNSFLYRKRIRPKKTQKPQTRTYAAIHTSNCKMKSVHREYNQAWWALNQLD